MKKKIIAIIGPTATDKSALGVRLAKKFNGEIISADSRQVYKGLNIGSGKITKREMSSVRHHLLDMSDPKKIYSVSDFQRDANIAINEVFKRNKLPIIVGGSGFYIDALILNSKFPNVTPDINLRAMLSKKSPAELFSILKKLDPKRAEKIDNKNEVRLIRAIEISKTLGKVPNTKSTPKYNVLYIGTWLERDKLKNKIHTRLLKRINIGMVTEVKKLHQAGLSWKRMEQLGLEYKWVSRYIRKKITKDEMINLLEMAICQFAKRQMTWFKRNKNIFWFDMNNKKSLSSIVSLTSKFVENKSKL